MYNVRKDINDYLRRIRLREYFYSEDDVGGDFSEAPTYTFRKKSNWQPYKYRELAIEAYAKSLEDQIINEIQKSKKSYSNLSSEERQALKNLKSYQDVVIKEADKGSGVVVMDKDKYIQEALRQLGDRNVYTELEQDPTQHIAQVINDRIRKLNRDGYIDDKTLDYLLINGNPKAGRFYLLPKLHKKGCPGRPVISGCNTYTEKISEFVDFHIKSLVPIIPSYIRDTKHFLQKLRDLGELPESAILVTADVVGLYPHIPHQDGLSALSDALRSKPRIGSTIPTDDIVELANMVLTNNNLVFNGRHYMQTQGTAIGTKMAPSYANIFMEKVESTILSGSPTKPYVWWRYLIIGN